MNQSIDNFNNFVFLNFRDVRRLVVAMSRARLGLYVFGRVNMFKNCFELVPAFNILTSRPVDGLHLCPDEVHPTSRQVTIILIYEIYKKWPVLKENFDPC